MLAVLTYQVSKAKFKIYKTSYPIKAALVVILEAGVETKVVVEVKTLAADLEVAGVATKVVDRMTVAVIPGAMVASVVEVEVVEVTAATAKIQVEAKIQVQKVVQPILAVIVATKVEVEAAATATVRATQDFTPHRAIIIVALARLVVFAPTLISVEEVKVRQQ
jgi:hypothetical protein